MQGDSRAVSARVIRDGDAWAADRSSPLALPLLILMALMSAGLVVYAAGNWALGAGFGAAVLAGAALLGWYRRLYPQEVAVGEAVSDWTVARAVLVSQMPAPAPLPWEEGPPLDHLPESDDEDEDDVSDAEAIMNLKLLAARLAALQKRREDG